MNCNIVFLKIKNASNKKLFYFKCQILITISTVVNGQEMYS